MAWSELTALRRQRSRTYQDDADPLKRALDANLATFHYPSVLDSGVCDAEVDFTPQYVNNAQLDGWRTTQNSWHYALGQPGDKPTDGWVGFGGRQGAHWFKFRLLRAGYLHWPTRAWDDIGGAPNYDRANLSRETGTIALATKGDEVHAASTATWQGLWSTPGGGDVSASWSARGTGLKELITVNQAGREWIAANRPPATPLSETYFGFVFQLDWSDIPKIIRAGIEQHVNNDFADDGEQIELHDVLDRLLAFLPISEVYVEQALLLQRARQPLRKRFYRDGANHYLLIGVRCDLLNAMPAGDLVFDPTINEDVGAEADDGYIRSGSADYANNDGTLFQGYYNNGSWYNLASHYRFTGISGLSGQTIDVSYIETYFDGTEGTAELIVHAEYAEAAIAPTTYGEFTGLVLTSESIQWDGAWSGTWNQSLSLNDVIQELADDFDPSAIQIIIANDGATGINYNKSRPWEYSPQGDYAAKLHIEYSAGGNPWYAYAQQ